MPSIMTNIIAGIVVGAVLKRVDFCASGQHVLLLMSVGVRLSTSMSRFGETTNNNYCDCPLVTRASRASLIDGDDVRGHEL